MGQTSTPSDPGLPRGGTRPARRQRRNRSILIALAVVVMGASVALAPQFQKDAAAIDDDRDISWDMSGGASAYNAMIEAVRQRATERPANEGSATLREGILRTNPTNTDVFSIDVTDRNVGQSSTDPAGFRLLMRARDLFIVGLHVALPTGQQQVIFLRGADNGYRGPDQTATLTELQFDGSYLELERTAGRGRAGQTVNTAAWEEAFRTMVSTVFIENRVFVRTNQQAIARALLMFIPGIAEAARFDPIQTAFAPTLENTASHTITTAEAKLMNDWSKASTATVASLESGTPFEFAIDDPATTGVDFFANSLQTMAAILAICLISNSS
jgi:hypothetical protein